MFPIIFKTDRGKLNKGYTYEYFMQLYTSVKCHIVFCDSALYIFIIVVFYFKEQSNTIFGEIDCCINDQNDKIYYIYLYENGIVVLKNYKISVYCMQTSIGLFWLVDIFFFMDLC